MVNYGDRMLTVESIDGRKTMWGSSMKHTHKITKIGPFDAAITFAFVLCRFYSRRLKKTLCRLVSNERTNYNLLNCISHILKVPT